MEPGAGRTSSCFTLRTDPRLLVLFDKMECGRFHILKNTQFHALADVEMIKYKARLILQKGYAVGSDSAVEAHFGSSSFFFFLIFNRFCLPQGRAKHVTE